MQSNSHLFHISSNFPLFHGFQTDVGFSKYLKKQSKLKKLVNHSIQNDHRDFPLHCF